jgi:hypothetical protein
MSKPGTPISHRKLVDLLPASRKTGDSSHVGRAIVPLDSIFMCVSEFDADAVEEGQIFRGKDTVTIAVFEIL